MARPTLTTHRKFRRLARLLGGQALARGTLELVWDVAYAAGEARIGDALDVEEAAQWQGERGACVQALVQCGFLDADPDGETFTVHDLFDHAPDYVFRRAEREQHRKAKGATLSDLRRQAANSRWHKPMQMDATDRHLHTGGDANDGTRAPAPARTPARTPTEAAGPIAAAAPRVVIAPLGARREHLNHACCGRVCLPAVLYAEFVRLHGGDEQQARAYVSEFFRTHDPPPDAGPIGDDGFTFWRKMWAAHHPSAAPDARTIKAAQRHHAGAAAEVAFLAARDDA